MKTVQHSQRGQQKQYDIVIIGTGIAGLSYALRVIEQQPQLKIALISKANLSNSNSFYAQGGIAAAMDEKSIDQHIQDTLLAGDGLCDETAVKQILNQGKAALAFLQKQGVQFSKDKNGQLNLTREGGHSQSCIYHYQDKTGCSIIETLIEKVKALPQIHYYEHHIGVNLITQSLTHEPGTFPQVIGAYILDEHSMLIHSFIAKVVILATGGAGKVYRYTTNPNIATGDGIAMAYRAGARVGNMEFYQFHPTLLHHPQCRNFLLSEALRGEGAYLCLPQSHERFMQKYAPEKMELATRDIVARAIFAEMESHGFEYVYLDMRHMNQDFLAKRFPTIYQTLNELGLNPQKDMIPVVPAAHYLCGGVLTDVNGKTDLPGLYVIGECAFTGLHGANRLASNSLLEAVVMASNAAQHSLNYTYKRDNINVSASEWDSTSVTDLRRASQISAHWFGLRGEMTSYAGIIRTAAGLSDLLELIQTRSAMIEAYYWKHTITRDLLELRNIILVAELIVKSALNRQESRGGHYRADFPQTLATKEETILQSNPYQHMISQQPIFRV